MKLRTNGPRGWRVAVMLALAPAWAGAQSFADGLRYQPQVDFASCAPAPDCPPAPALWEGVDAEPAPAAPVAATMPARAEPAGTSPVPEPRSIGLMLAGLALVALIALRRRTPRPVLPSLRFPL